METKSKTYLIIISTFVLGMVAGVLLAPMILGAPPPEQHSRRWDSKEGFVQRFEDFIQPTDEQREQVRTILEQHSLKFMRGRRQMMDQVRLDMDTLRQQLYPILTDEQKQRFEERMRHEPRRRRRN
ncbi:MAG: hypothetical protein KDD94_07640 [Calditrichaeota bacterium]|nr:hypothetical protein [Calditrichota bacterium]